MTVTLPASLASSASLSTELYCPQCGHELEKWEIHLLKYLDCPCCGAKLEFGATMRVDLPLD